MDNFFQQVYAIVAKIPEGYVLSYGSISQFLGKPRGGRIVGWAMKVAPEHLPNHRVVKKNGELAQDMVFGNREYQEARLLAEGITFDENGQVNMDKHLWQIEDIRED